MDHALDAHLAAIVHGEEEMETTDRYYRGNGGRGTVTVVPYTGLVYPLPHLVKHSPDGFAWGYGGSGPSDLARSMLMHHLTESGWHKDWYTVNHYYMDFKWDIIAQLPDDFELTSHEIDTWLLEKLRRFRWGDVLLKQHLAERIRNRQAHTSA